MNKIFKEIPELNNKLSTVQKLIHEELTTDETKFSETIKAYFNANAKLIRPAFVLTAASYKDSYPNEEDIACAAAVEMLHVASLIHDDIIDNASTRRGIETVNKSHDVGYAVICGDFLYAKSYQLLFDTQNIAGLKYVGSKVCNMAFGEVMQYYEKFNSKLTVEKYLDIIASKSAALFQSNLIVGANLAGVDEKEQELLASFGLNYGLLFQIQDDILDYLNKDMYKPIKSDLNRGIYTLPIIICTNKSDEFRTYLDSGNIDMETVLDYIEKYSGVEESLHYLEKYYQNCCDILEKLSSDKARSNLKYILDITYRRLT